MNDYDGGGPASVLGISLGVDAIQEFSVVTGNAPADYGKTSGGVIDAVTRAGTNQLHGSLYEFLRNSALDARNFFDGHSVPPFKRNQFGGSLGGPIRRQKTFFSLRRLVRLLDVLWWRYFDSLSEERETSCSGSESRDWWFACMILEW